MTILVSTELSRPPYKPTAADFLAPDGPEYQEYAKDLSGY